MATTITPDLITIGAVASNSCLATLPAQKASSSVSDSIAASAVEPKLGGANSGTPGTVTTAAGKKLLMSNNSDNTPPGRPDMLPNNPEDTIVTIERSPSDGESTLGKMFINGKFECHTLEDVTRPGEPKVYGKTAIPSGRYPLTINHSQKFGKQMPLVCDVPGFSGIRIHQGTTSKHTDGCILVGSGTTPSGNTSKLTGSTEAFSNLMPKLQNAVRRGKVYIDIR